MKEKSSIQALQNFIFSINQGKFDTINVTTIEGQTQALDHLLQLLHCCENYRKNIPEGLQIHPEFFAIPCVEKFFTDLFAKLHESLLPKAEIVFLRGLAFTVDYIGLPKSRETVYLLLEKLQERFPDLKQMHDTAIDNYIEEFFRPTIGNFIKQYKDAIDHFEVTYPLLFALFIDPLNAPQFADHRLYNFYCNPWIYQWIMKYLTFQARLSSPEINRRLLEKSIDWIEERLQIIHSQTSDESWKELRKKAKEALNHSKELEPFAIELAGLFGEIKTASQFIKYSCDPEDILEFLPPVQGEPNCDLMVKLLKANSYELIECKAKTPRHGLDEKTAGEAQIWDDFFTNFNHAISSYLTYLQETVQPPLGLIKTFPLFLAHEASNYGCALPLLENIPITADSTPLKIWTSKQKLSHLLRALFLRPLILNPCCEPLQSNDARLIQRKQDIKEALQREWVNTLLEKATTQLEKTYTRQKTGGREISKMYVALDLELSYRLLHDPFSYNDGDVQKSAEQALQEVFQPFKEAFTSNGIDLHLLVIQP